jgi:hypothetical protein
MNPFNAIKKNPTHIVALNAIENEFPLNHYDITKFAATGILSLPILH